MTIGERLNNIKQAKDQFKKDIGDSFVETWNLKEKDLENIANFIKRTKWISLKLLSGSLSFFNRGINAGDDQLLQEFKNIIEKSAGKASEYADNLYNNQDNDQNNGKFNKELTKNIENSSITNEENNNKKETKIKEEEKSNKISGLTEEILEQAKNIEFTETEEQKQLYDLFKESEEFEGELITDEKESEKALNEIETGIQRINENQEDKQAEEKQEIQSEHKQEEKLSIFDKFTKKDENGNPASLYGYIPKLFKNVFDILVGKADISTLKDVGSFGTKLVTTVFNSLGGNLPGFGNKVWALAKTAAIGGGIGAVTYFFDDIKNGLFEALGFKNKEKNTSSSEVKETTGTSGLHENITPKTGEASKNTPFSKNTHSTTSTSNNSTTNSTNSTSSSSTKTGSNQDTSSRNSTNTSSNNSSNTSSRNGFSENTSRSNFSEDISRTSNTENNRTNTSSKSSNSEDVTTNKSNTENKSTNSNFNTSSRNGFSENTSRNNFSEDISRVPTNTSHNGSNESRSSRSSNNESKTTTRNGIYEATTSNSNYKNTKEDSSTGSNNTRSNTTHEDISRVSQTNQENMKEDISRSSSNTNGSTKEDIESKNSRSSNEKEDRKAMMAKIFETNKSDTSNKKSAWDIVFGEPKKNYESMEDKKKEYSDVIKQNSEINKSEDIKKEAEDFSQAMKTRLETNPIAPIIINNNTVLTENNQTNINNNSGMRGGFSGTGRSAYEKPAGKAY